MMKVLLILITIICVSAILSFVFSTCWHYGRRIFLRKKRYSGPIQRKIGQHYYTLTGPLSHLKVSSYIDSGTFFDVRNHQKGIYFLNMSDALKRIDEIEELNLR